MSHINKTAITIDNKTILRVIFWVVASFLFLNFMSKELHIITLLFTSLFLALALNPAVSWLSQRFKIKSRVKATALAYLIVIALLSTFISLVVPPLVRQSIDFVKSVPDTIDSFQTQDTAIARSARKYKIDEKLSQFGNDIRDNTLNYKKPVLDTAGRVGGTLASGITIMILTFMMLVEGPLWLNKFWELQPTQEKEKVRNKKIASKMYRTITNYINGQVLIATIAAAFALIALMIASSIFNVSINAVALAGIVFLFGLIPLIGNTLASVIVFIVCLFSSIGLAITMLIFFIVYQQIENASLQPYIQAKNNDMTPLLVFVAAIVGAGFGGIFGAFIAIPTAACCKILLEEYLTRRNEKLAQTIKN